MNDDRDDKKKRRREEKRQRQWAEVEEYRALLEAPEPNRFDEGFTIRTIIGVLFISLIMTPGEMFLGLYTGGGVGAAAQWVTVILFLEVSKRSFTSLKRQEIYLLVYVASALIAREEGAFLDLLWRQYFVRSAEAELFGISRILPWWWAPPPDSEAIAERTFIHRDWLAPILLLVIGTIMGRIAWFTSGYMLFRLTSDREQLPFPTAPMSALSAMALAEDSGAEKETWKWPVFSIGAAIGASFGVIYVGVPVVTQLWGSKVEILPIPFWDLTPYFGNILPATPLGIAVHLGPIFSGLLMPFWSVVGSFSGVMLHTAISPFLYELGYLPRWEVGMDTIQTSIATGIDFWRAFSIGITIAVTIVSFYQLFSTGREKRAELREKLQLEKADQRLGALRNQISDISVLAGLLSLRYLRLAGNPISDTCPLAGLPRLRDIDIEISCPEHVPSPEEDGIQPEDKQPEVDTPQGDGGQTQEDQQDDSDRPDDSTPQDDSGQQDSGGQSQDPTQDNGGQSGNSTQQDNGGQTQEDQQDDNDRSDDSTPQDDSGQQDSGGQTQEDQQDDSDRSDDSTSQDDNGQQQQQQGQVIQEVVPDDNNELLVSETQEQKQDPPPGPGTQETCEEQGGDFTDTDGFQLCVIIEAVTWDAPSINGHKMFIMDRGTLEQLDPAKLEAHLDIWRSESDGSAIYLRSIALLESVLAAIRPDKTQLLPNYPNPFNPETWIPYHLANAEVVVITIYDARGSVVRHLDLGHQSEGYYTSRSRAAYWDGRNEIGESVASGVYFYQLRAGNISLLRKMVILK